LQLLTFSTFTAELQGLILEWNSLIDEYYDSVGTDGLTKRDLDGLLRLISNTQSYLIARRAAWGKQLLFQMLLSFVVMADELWQNCFAGSCELPDEEVIGTQECAFQISPRLEERLLIDCA
jgi:hypothetical protein